MDNNNRRPAQGGPEPTMDTGDWRGQLQNESRQRIVNKIMDTLKRHLPFSGQEGLQELKKIAIRFEEKIYTAATSQSDYLRKISLKMLTMESKSQNTMANALPSNSASNSQNPMDAGSLGMQSQIGNQGPPMGANQGQARQQLLSQGVQNNVTATTLQGSSNLTSTMPGGGGLPQTNVPNVGQNINSQNMPGITGVSQNSVANSMGQGLSANMYANTQRQMQGRQPVTGQQQQQQQQQQPQNQQQILYQQQLQQQYRQKYPQGAIQNPHMQSQQNLLQSSQQSVMQSNLQSQQSSVQPSQSMLQQNPQILRQHTQMQPQSMLPHTQQQQQLLGQQPSSTSLHPNQLLGQQNNMSDMQQQQRLLGQQNNLSSLQQQAQQQLMGQQQLGSQGNVSGIHQQQQHQMHGNQSGNSSMQNNQIQNPVQVLQQNKVTIPQQNQQNSAVLQPSQGQHSQPQMPSQQLLPQMQSQPGQLQQQLGMQQQQNSLHRDMQQRLQTTGPLLQSQNMIDHQKQQLFQSQRTIADAPSTSLDSTDQTENMNGGDWQEEIYQKIKTMKEAYLPELNEMYLKIAGKLQQHDNLPQQPKNDQVEKLKVFKAMLERIMTFLQVPKNNIVPAFKEKLAGYEKQIINFLNSNRPRKLGPSMQQPQQIPPPHMQQQQSQISQVQPRENSMSSQVQPMNVQGSVNTLQQNNVTSLHHNSLSSLSGVSNASQNIMNSLQSNSNVDSGQGNPPNTMQQVAVGMQQSVSAPQQVNMNSLPSQNGMSSLQPNFSPLQPNSNMLQHQQLKQQEQQMLQNHQMKQKIHQHHLQQQLMHKQQLLQQQQQQQQQMIQQTKLQQNSQLQPPQAQQNSQLNQMNDMDMKMRQQLGVKGSGFQQNQRSMYHHQQLKSGSSFPISSPQLLQAASPQIPQHPSPQIDQHNLLPSLTKSGTPLQSANSPFIAPSPSTPFAPSPMPGESEKGTSGVSALLNSGAIGHQAAASVTPAQSLAIGTPGISASPLLAEFTSPDGTQGNVSTVVPGKSSATEQPLERLLRAVKSMSPNGLSAAVGDIGSVVGMIDRIAGSAPGNGSRAAVGEDLVAMTKCRLQARNFMTQDGNGGTRKMRRFTSAMPLNVASSCGSANDSFKHVTVIEATDLVSTATSSIKKPKVEASHALLEEIREINQRLIDTVLDVSDEDVDATAAAASEGGEGTIVKCSYCAVALSPDLKALYASPQMSPIQPLRLLVPTNYPNSSPILLDKFPIEVSKEHEDLSSKAKSRFGISLRNLSQPMSLGEIAKTWDVCARTAISEFAQQSGGGTFSSKYGTWENLTSAA